MKTGLNAFLRSEFSIPLIISLYHCVFLNTGSEMMYIFIITIPLLSFLSGAVGDFIKT